jgi:DNA sulfur modification protein DndE
MRINSSKKSEDLMAKLTAIFGFSSESIICRIAIAITLQKDQRFPLDIEPLDRKGKDFLSESNLFGLAPNRESYSIIYRALFDQHYSQNLSEDAFKVLFNHHLELGLDLIYSEISVNDYQVVDKHSYLMKAVKRGLDLVGKNTLWDSGSSEHKSIGYYEGLIEVVLGNNEKGHDIKLRINDLNEFDSCNMAIAGMVGSGKTELVKDILYQIVS